MSCAAAGAGKASAETFGTSARAMAPSEASWISEGEGEGEAAALMRIVLAAWTMARGGAVWPSAAARCTIWPASNSSCGEGAGSAVFAPDAPATAAAVPLAATADGDAACQSIMAASGEGEGASSTARMSVTMPGWEGPLPTSGRGDASCVRIWATGEAAIMLMGGETRTLRPHALGPSDDETSSAWGIASRLISLAKLGVGEAEGEAEGEGSASSTATASASPGVAGGTSTAGGAGDGGSGGGLDGGAGGAGDGDNGCRRSASVRDGWAGRFSSRPSGKKSNARCRSTLSLVVGSRAAALSADLSSSWACSSCCSRKLVSVSSGG